MSEASAFERLLRRDRMITAAGLVLLCALAWAYVLTGAGLGMDVREMTSLSLFPHRASAAPEAMPGMDMASMDEPAPIWSPRVWLLTIGMWMAMMLAMMTPSAAPAILLYGRVRAQAGMQGRAAGVGPNGAFAAGYLLVWLTFSAAAAALHWALEQSALLSSAMASQSRWLSAAVLLAAGAYQLSPLKNHCLNQCRSSAQFLSRHWRPGVAGAVRLGALHGAYCVGCCWVLMGLLFVGGVMNLVWIAALTLLVMVEKLLPGGRWAGRIAGAALLAWAGATLVS